MVDLETLATTPNAAILTIGAVTFNPNGYEVYDEFYARVDTESIEPLDTYIDDGTVKWWSDQDKAAQDEAFNPTGRRHIKDVMETFINLVWAVVVSGVTVLPLTLLFLNTISVS